MTKKARPELTEKKPSSDDSWLNDAHPDHDHHLCHIVGLRNLKTAAKLSQNAKHLCFICGRAAKDQKNLCEPIKI